MIRKHNKATKRAALFAVMAFFVLLLSTTPASAATVKMSPKTKTVAVGKTVKIKLLNNKKAVKWSVSNSRATITKKTKTYVRVRGKKAGKCTIKAKAGKKTYTCKLTVKAAGARPADDTGSYSSSLSDIEIVKNFNFRSKYGSYFHHFTAIKNVSGRTLDISASTIAYNKDRKEVSVANSSLQGLPNGCTTLLDEVFDTNETIGSFDRKFTLNESSYAPVLQNLSYTISNIDGGAIVKVTNNGTEDANFVEGYTLFLKGGKIVDYDWTYYDNEGVRLTPGSTAMRQANTTSDFDEVQFYMTGRGDFQW